MINNTNRQQEYCDVCRASVRPKNLTKCTVTPLHEIMYPSFTSKNTIYSCKACINVYYHVQRRREINEPKMQDIKKRRIAQSKNEHVKEAIEFSREEQKELESSLNDFYKEEELSTLMQEIENSSPLVKEKTTIHDMELVKIVFKKNYPHRDEHFHDVMQLFDLIGNDKNSTNLELKQQERLFDRKVTHEQVMDNVLEHINRGTTNDMFLSYIDKTTFNLIEEDDTDPKEVMLIEFDKWSKNETCGTFWLVPMINGVSTLCKDNNFRFTRDVGGTKPRRGNESVDIDDMLASNAGAFSSPHIDQCCLTAQSIMLGGLKLFIVWSSRSDKSIEQCAKCSNSENPLKYLIQNYHEFGPVQWIVMGPGQRIDIDVNTVHTVVSLTNSSLYGCMYVEYTKYADLVDNMKRYIRFSKSMQELDDEQVHAECNKSLELWELSCTRLENDVDGKHIAAAVRQAVYDAKLYVQEIFNE